jgi:arsenate reductase
MTQRVLFLCNHNAFRSQMAEALLRHVAGDRFIVESAGSEPTAVHPLAVAAMREVGIDIRRQRARDFNAIKDSPDIVITLCDEARESCPVFPGASRLVHWNLPDPSAALGDEPARLAVFRQVRDRLAGLIHEFLKGVE